LKKPYIEYSDVILKKYSIDGFLDDILSEKG